MIAKNYNLLAFEDKVYPQAHICSFLMHALIVISLKEQFHNGIFKFL